MAEWAKRESEHRVIWTMQAGRLTLEVHAGRNHRGSHDGCVSWSVRLQDRIIDKSLGRLVENLDAGMQAAGAEAIACARVFALSVIKGLGNAQSSAPWVDKAAVDAQVPDVALRALRAD